MRAAHKFIQDVLFKTRIYVLEGGKSMKKRVISVLTVIALIISLGLPAFATGTISSGDVKIVNNYAGTKDTVTVDNSSNTNLLAGEKIKVYKADQTTVLGTSAVAAKNSNNVTEAAISINQVSSDTKGLSGSVYISILSGTNFGTESTKTKVDFDAEPTTTTPAATYLTIKNQASDGSDTITLAGLQSGWTLKAYATDATTASAIGMATVKDSTTTASITMSGSKLGDSAGTVYLTLTEPSANKKHESARQPFSYSAVTKVTFNTTVAVVNSVDSKYKDTITLTGLQAGDKLTAYSSSTDLSAKNTIGTATVPTKGDTTTAAISLPANKFTKNAGNIYVNVKRKGYVTSDIVTVAVPDEAVSTSPLLSNITANNFNGDDNIRDVVTVKGLTSGDTVYVYNSATDATSIALLMKGTVKDKRTSISLATPNKNKDFSATSGKVYVSVKSVNKEESGRTAVDYTAEP